MNKCIHTEGEEKCVWPSILKAENQNWEIGSSQSGSDVAPGQVNGRVDLVQISRHRFRNEGVPSWGPVSASSVLVVCGS